MPIDVMQKLPDVLRDVRSRIYTYAGMPPDRSDKDDEESWESWFEAAFDMLSAEVTLAIEAAEANCARPNNKKEQPQAEPVLPSDIETDCEPAPQEVVEHQSPEPSLYVSEYELAQFNRVSDWMTATIRKYPGDGRIALYTHPAPQAKPPQQQPLTDEQIREAVNGAGMMFTAPDIKVARAIEAAHGINSVSE